MSLGLGRTGSFTSAAARDALEFVRESGGGTILVTSGLRDLRLVVEPGRVVLEALGYALEGEGAPGVVRGFLCALFWEDPSYQVEPGSSVDEHPEAARIEVATDEEEVVEELAAGCAELAELQRRIPGLDCLVAVKGDPPPEAIDEPSANLFRAAVRSPKGAYLVVAAEEAKLDPLDAAWAASDLLEADRASVHRAPKATVGRRLKRSELQAGDGFLRALRYAHLARCYQRFDGRRAATYHRLAGSAYLAELKPSLAVASYTSCLAVEPEDLVAREGLLAASEAAGEPTQHVRRLHQELARTFLGAGLPARARTHFEAAGEEAQLLLDCALRMRDFEGALELARRLVPDLSADERLGLAQRFAAAGARGKTLERAVRLSGLGSRRKTKALLYLVAFLLFLLAGAAGGEVYLRLLYRSAAAAAAEDVAGGDLDAARARFAELAPIVSQAAPLRLAEWPPEVRERLTLARVPQVLAGISAREADLELVARSEEALRWRAAPDALAAKAALEALTGEARTRALARALRARVAEIEAYREQVAAQVRELEELVTAGRLDDALALGRRLRREHGRARDLWEDAQVRALVRVNPAEALLYQNGARLEPVRSGEWSVTVPLDGAETTIRAVAANHVADARALVIDELSSSSVRLDLIEVRRLAGESAPAGRGAGLFVSESPRPLSDARRLLARGKPVEVAASDAHLAPLAELLRPGERLSVVLRSEVRLNAFYLKELDLFLVDTASGKAAEPRRVIPELARRELTEREDGVVVIQDLSCVGDLPRLQAALRVVLAEMQEELR